jgi:hypothetical protein
LPNKWVGSQILGYIVKVRSQFFLLKIWLQDSLLLSNLWSIYIEVELIFSNQKQNKVAMRLPQILMNKNSSNYLEVKISWGILNPYPNRPYSL